MRRIARTATGIALLAAAVALSLPGVRAVRAEPAAAAPSPASAPMCRADAPLAPPEAVDELAQALAAQAAADGERPEIRVLNNRGYRYGSMRGAVDLSALAREIRMQRETR